MGGTFGTSGLDDLLAAWSGRADVAALDAAMPLLYLELKSLATQALRSQPGAALETTALVHETYLRLRDREAVWNVGRQALVAMAAQAMRRILVDDARRRDALKRQPVALTDWPDNDGRPAPDVLAVDRLLDELSALSERQARVVEMRCFAGMNLEDVAETLGIGRATVVRDWRIARSWLARRMEAVDDGR